MDNGSQRANINLAMRHKHKDMSIVQELQVFMQNFHPFQDAGGIEKGEGSGAMDELGPGETVIDGPAESLIRKDLGQDKVNMRLIGISKRVEEISGGFVQIAVRGKDKRKMRFGIRIAMPERNDRDTLARMLLQQRMDIAHIKRAVRGIVAFQLSGSVGRIVGTVRRFGDDTGDAINILRSNGAIPMEEYPPIPERYDRGFKSYGAGTTIQDVGYAPGQPVQHMCRGNGTDIS